jgi:hypothetical protein
MSGHVGIVVDKVALGQVFSEYFSFPCQSSFQQLLHNHRLSSGAGTIGQQWPTYQVDSVSPHPEKLKTKLLNIFLEGMRKIMKTSVRKAGLQAEIRTRSNQLTN